MMDPLDLFDPNDVFIRREKPVCRIETRSQSCVN